MNRLLVALLIAPAALAADVEPGNWELSHTTMATGMGKPVTQVLTRCFTDADARDPGRILGDSGSCRFWNKNDAGGVTTFELACGGPLPLKGTGIVRFDARTMEVDLDLLADDRNFAVRTLIQGRRLGPC